MEIETVEIEQPVVPKMADEIPTVIEEVPVLEIEIPAIDPHVGLVDAVAAVMPAPEPIATYPKSATCSRCGGDAYDTGGSRGGELKPIHDKDGQQIGNKLVAIGPSAEFEVKCADEACGWIGFRHF